MATVVYQGLQSFHESHLMETRTLRLKLAMPNSSFFDSIGLARAPSIPDIATNDELTKKSHNYEEINMSSSNSLQALSNSSQSPKQAFDREISYVHPMVKRSSSMLSDKSLELCTENLGSETGSDIIESSIFSLSSLDLEDGDQTPTRENSKSSQYLESRKVNYNSSRNFPPPLTTISGSNSMQFRPHREGGRLIIKAMEAPSPRTYLQAERSNGRLRLCFWKDYNSGEENEDSDMEEEENEAYDEEKQENEEEEMEEFEEQEDGEDESGEDMDGNRLDVEVEMGMEKFQRPSRCKEGGDGNKSLCNWEPFWVATS